jgi:hypothetical protein
MGKQIIVRPRAGLANRMRLIASCLYLKYKFQAEMKMIWDVNSGLNARYEDLFELNQGITLLDGGSKYDLIIKHKKLVENKSSVVRAISKGWNSLISQIIGVDYCLFDEDLKKGYAFIKSILEKHDRVFFCSCEEFVDYPDGISSFTPIPAIKEKIRLNSEKFDENTVGIHIRRTDNISAIEASPNYLFERKIEEYLQENSATNFFIATDDPAVESYFKEKYPDNVLAYPKTYGRDSKDGIVDALVELQLLAKTSVIYGSYWSSYSEMASRIGKIKLNILTLAHVIPQSIPAAPTD